MWSIQCTVAPTVEPISIDEAKAFARIDTDADDPLVGDLITSARMMLESITARCFVTSTYKLVMDSFRQNYTGQWFDVFRVPNPPQVLGASAFGNVIYPFMVMYVPRPPLQSVTSLQYIDTAGATQTLVNGTDYLVDTTGQQGRITPQYGTVWPWARAQINSVTLTYVAGYAYDTTPLPVQPVWWSPLRQLLKMTVANWYYDRQQGELPAGSDALLSAIDYGRYN